MDNKLLDKVKKNYKNTELLLDIYLENYHACNIYIRLDYYKKLRCYKLSWIDLSHINGNNIDSVISYEYIPNGVIEHLEKLINNISFNKDLKTVKDEYKVTINSNIKTNQFKLVFNRYIPKEINSLFNIMVIIFDNLPRKLNGFLQELSALIIGNQSKYEYQEEFNFDLFRCDVDKIFDYQIVKRGKEYYDEGRVLFLEKVGDRYFSVVGGKGLYVIIIKYDEDKKTAQVYCSCPCEFKCKHIYAVLLAIRNNKFHKFYKITHKNNDMELLDRIMNFNFLLTIGIDDQNNNYLVIEDGELKLLPVVNDRGNSEWIVLEDDDKNTLTKRLSSILGESYDDKNH